MTALDRPNFVIYTPNEQYAFLGENNLRREFRDCFSIILSSCYEDDTISARYFNKLNEDGTSCYYVSQPEIEEKLNTFLQSLVDDDKYLIGFTGIGKTTLLKNFFKINDAEPFFTNSGKLIAYLSVFSDDIKDEDALLHVFCSFMQTIVDKLIEKIPFDSQCAEHQESLYQYAIQKKKRLVVEEINFESTPKNTAQLLNMFKNQHPLDFYATLISFLIEKINIGSSLVRELILVYDDIEAQKPELHIPFISFAEEIAAKLKGTAHRRTYVVKSLISMRNYTFRFHYARQSDARRNYTEDVILKKKIPRMKEIFNKRFQVYYDNEDIRAAIPNEQRWTDATAVLARVVDDIADFGDTISAIANYDISHSLKMFLRVLTNHRWFAPDETYYQGSYASLDPEVYQPVKERTFKALTYGEETIFVDSEDNLLPNVLRFHEEEEDSDVELMPLYVMEYMLSMQRSNEVTLYGEHSIEGKSLKESIVRILQLKDREELVDYVIGRLYIQRCLLRSIFQAEEQCGDHHRSRSRKYDSSYNLYLSLRGNKIMELLANDSLLLEFFRDDIDTNIPGNKVPSADMLQTHKLLYLIDYCTHLFKKEQIYISKADQEQYFRWFGGSFVTFRLLRGIYNTYRYYYKKKDTDDAQSVWDAVNNLFNSMHSYQNNLLATNSNLRINLSFDRD